MESNDNHCGLTRKDLVRLTGMPPYLVRYLTDCNRLPILKPSSGPGDPVIYSPDAVRVIQERQRKKRPLEVEQV